MAADGSVHVEDPVGTQTFCGLPTARGRLTSDAEAWVFPAKRYFLYWYRQVNPKFCAACKAAADAS